MGIHLDALEVPEGEYEVAVFLSDTQAGVGNARTRRTQSALSHITVSFESYWGCTEVTLGDSLYLVVLTNSFGEPWLTTSTTAPWQHQGYTWEVWISGDRLDTQYLVDLDSNGLFFPLKVTDRGNGYYWTVKAMGGPESPLEMDIVVRRPDGLGTDYNEFDEYILTWANHFAVPPQIVKAIVHKESKPTFEMLSYRYEMGFDYGIMQPSLRAKQHYRDYLLADSARTGTPPGFDRYGASVARGQYIAGLEPDPYAVLAGYSLDTVYVADNNSDGLITARELASLNWDLFGSKQPPSDSDFVSQLLLCGSHGPMQPLQVSLIDFVDFQSSNPQVHFTDTSQAIHWGTKFFEEIWDGYTDTEYAWNTRWRTAIGRYNGGPGATETNGIFNDPNVNAYIDLVLQYVDDYQPIPAVQ